MGQLIGLLYNPNKKKQKEAGGGGGGGVLLSPSLCRTLERRTFGKVYFLRELYRKAKYQIINSHRGFNVPSLFPTD